MVLIPDNSEHQISPFLIEYEIEGNMCNLFTFVIITKYLLRKL